MLKHIPQITNYMTRWLVVKQNISQKNIARCFEGISQSYGLFEFLWRGSNFTGFFVAPDLCQPSPPLWKLQFLLHSGTNNLKRNVLPQKMNEGPLKKGPCWKELNHLPTINFQGIFVSFHGRIFWDLPIPEFQSPLPEAWWSKRLRSIHVKAGRDPTSGKFLAKNTNKQTNKQTCSVYELPMFKSINNPCSLQFFRVQLKFWCFTIPRPCLQHDRWSWVDFYLIFGHGCLVTIWNTWNHGIVDCSLMCVVYSFVFLRSRERICCSLCVWVFCLCNVRSVSCLVSLFLRLYPMSISAFWHLHTLHWLWIYVLPVFRMHFRPLDPLIQWFSYMLHLFPPPLLVFTFTDRARFPSSLISLFPVSHVAKSHWLAVLFTSCCWAFSFGTFLRCCGFV